MKFGQQSDAAFADIQVGLGVPNFPYKALKKQLKASAAGAKDTAAIQRNFFRHLSFEVRKADRHWMLEAQLALGVAAKRANDYVRIGADS